MKWLSLIAVAALCAACGNAAPAGETGTAATAPNTAASASTPAATAAATPAPAPAAAPVADPPKPAFHEVTLPAGTTLRLKMTSAVASDTSKVEEPVHAELAEAVKVDGDTALPAGAEVSGVVTDVQQSGRVKGRARVAYRFTSVRAHGETYEIKTAAIAQQARATKGKDARNVAIGAGVGAALGAVLGGGGGAAKGAAVGGAGGAGYDLATRGEEVHIGPGAVVTARLTAPLVVRVKN